MSNLPSVSYMIGQFQEAMSGRKTHKDLKSFRKLKYWSLVQPWMLLELLDLKSFRKLKYWSLVQPWMLLEVPLFSEQ